MYYRRDGSPYPNVLDWAEDFEHSNRHVAETTLPDGTWVSTVWLGLDQQYSNGPPLIFETMVFGNDDAAEDLQCDLWCERYSTEEQAKEGHERLCRERPWQREA